MFKPSTDSARHLVFTEKKTFSVLGLGFSSGGGLQEGGGLAYFTRPSAPTQRANSFARVVFGN